MHRKHHAFTWLAGLTLFAAAALAHENPEPKEAPVTRHASGTFDVNIAPLDLHFDAGDKLGRMSIRNNPTGPFGPPSLPTRSTAWRARSTTSLPSIPMIAMMSWSD